MLHKLLIAGELREAICSEESLGQWRPRYDRALEDDLAEIINETLADAVGRLNNLGHRLYRYTGPMNDRYGYADYETSGTESVRLWLSAHIVITNHLLWIPE